MIRPLTDLQIRYLDFISRYREQYNYSPTAEEMVKEFGVVKSTVHQNLHAIMNKGYIYVDNLPRSIKILNPFYRDLSNIESDIFGYVIKNNHHYRDIAKNMGLPLSVVIAGLKKLVKKNYIMEREDIF